MSQDRLVTLSKRLSWLLRHGADQSGLPLDSEGFLPISKLLSHKDFRQFTLADVESVTASNQKQRFTIKEDERREKLIRANQGHTLQVENLELTEITDCASYPTVVHGTRLSNWESIQTTGLSRMARQHIHFAMGIPGEDHVISGMRGNSDLWIFVDLESALRDGFHFFRSSNNVILTPGNADGFLPSKYFLRVVRRQRGGAPIEMHFKKE